MAQDKRDKRGRRRRKVDPTPKKRAGKLPPPDPETETIADAKLVNALESNPEFFKDPLIGQTLGKCKIEKLIGEGKTSVVYRAHYKPLKRTVAVKVLQEHMAKEPSVLRVFQREGRAVAALDHENILKIYDVGEDQGKYFLVLELLRGDELKKVIDDSDDNRLDVPHALEYARQTAKGLAAAHRKNLIHRDIKPQNLVIEPDGVLKIVDFGLAAEAEGAFAGGKLGTPHFMAPEQCRGELAVPATDIYALGITLYHMLVGHPPYQGEKTTDAIIERHLEGKRLEPEKKVAGLPAPVCQLIRRMTRMDAAQRPSADEVAEAIEKLAKSAGKPGRAAGGRRGAGRRAAQAPQSNNSALIGIGAIVVIGLAGLIFLMGGKDDEDDPAAQANQPPTKKKGGKKKSTPKVDPKPKDEPKASGDESLDQLMLEAKREERNDNLQEAKFLYDRVMKLNEKDKENAYYKEAEVALKHVKKEIRARRSGNRKKRVTLKMTEVAAGEFAERQAEFSESLKRFQVAIVIKEIEALLKRMRKDAPEREPLEAMLEDISWLNDLIGLVEGRAASLSGGSERWNTYDLNAEEEMIVLGADMRGVEIKNDVTGTTKIVSWARLSNDTAIAFLDALRSPTSGMDAFRLGYYCHVLGDDRADTYFKMAVRADSSLRADVNRAKSRK